MSDCNKEKKCHLSIKSKTERENGKLLYQNTIHTNLHNTLTVSNHLLLKLINCGFKKIAQIAKNT